jgi:hypothetical protein
MFFRATAVRHEIQDMNMLKTTLLPNLTPIQQDMAGMATAAFRTDRATIYPCIAEPVGT